MTEPQVILRSMDETRADLADKIDTLEQHVMDTVHEARDAVMDTVQGAKDSVTGTVASVKDAVQETVGVMHDTMASLQDAFNLERHVRTHPWAMLGGSIVLGYLAGNLLSRSGALAGRAVHRAWSPTGTSAVAPEGPLSAFGEEIAQLKKLAVGTMMGAARDFVAKSLPPGIQEHVVEVIDRVTSKLGG